jgi:hypothetical protein
MANVIVGHIDLNTTKRQSRVNFPAWATDMIRAEGIGHIVVSFDTDALALTAKAVREDVAADTEARQ